MGEHDRAIADYTRAISIGPHPTAFNYRGLTYASKGEYDRAIADYNEAININPRYSRAYINRGNAYVDKGENTRAMEDFDNAVRLSSEFHERINIDNNIIALATRTYDKAIETLEKFISDPDNCDTPARDYYDGVLYLFSGNQDQARRCFEYAKEDGYEPLCKVEQHLENLKG